MIKPMYLLLLLISCSMHAQPVQPVAGKPQPLPMRTLPVGSVLATGWLKTAIDRNLNGFTGWLDSLAPALVVHDDIYAANRIKPGVTSKDLGAVSDGGDWQVQFLWWNSETQGNWLDGLLRGAIVTRHRQGLQKAEAMVQHILQSQDTNGYIGIYDTTLRYRFDNENGELWSKATILRFLLAWYGYARQPAVLKAVERAVQDVMVHWPAGQSQPFYSVKPDVSGLSHGLMFTDVLLELYQLTGNRQYLDYGVFLYNDFSRHTLHEDAQLGKLLNPALQLQGHGVHTYEHVRAVALSWYATGAPSLQQALMRFIAKIEFATTPSGAPAGDEFIGARRGHAYHTGYEFCSLHELMHSWITLFQLTGITARGDAAEKILFNAALGATHPQHSAICYLKTDNVFMLTGGKHGDTTDPHQTRYRYSPVHQEAAVCCVPNAGRIFPYYVQHMWMQDDAGFINTLLGPGNLRTTWQQQPVEIEAQTGYPFDSTITYRIRLSEPTAFQLKIRKPGWAGKVFVSVPYTEANGMLVIDRTWKPNDIITLRFHMPARVVSTADGQEAYIERGPLVLCRKVDAAETVTRRFAIAGMAEREYRPLQPAQAHLYAISAQPSLQLQAFPRCRVLLRHPVTQQWAWTDLAPMAGTLLRQVSFTVEHNR